MLITNKLELPKLRLLTKKDFDSAVNCFPKDGFVDNPWTHNEIVKGSKIFTDRVSDCTVGGFSAGKNIDGVLSHIRCVDFQPGTKFPFPPVAKVLNNLIDFNQQGLHAFIFGSICRFADSNVMFKHFLNYSQDNNIPVTFLRGNKNGNATSVAFDSSRHEWLISNESISKDLALKTKSLGEILKDAFVAVKIDPRVKLASRL